MTNGGRKLVKPDLAVPIGTAQAIVDRAQPGRTVSAISHLHGGEVSAVYEVAFADAQAPLVLKLYPDRQPWKMQKAVTVAALLQDRIGVPIPHILVADDSKSLLGLNFILMSKLEGELLERLEPKLAAEEVSSAYTQMGHALHEFHLIPMKVFGDVGAQGGTAHVSNRAYMSFQFDNKLKEFVDRRGTPAIARRVRAYASARAHLFEGCAVPVLCHNDFHASNVLATTMNGALRLSGILDFENALAGDALLDIAKTLYYAVKDSELKLTALLAGYGPMQRRDRDEAIALYRLYCALELWCWSAQVGDFERLPSIVRDMESYSD